ncbi:MAG: STAS domain-containing protein [Planctomycetaceae bacterium]|nr:STAS domain-containing protein [Planctomycetaceae bacterium]
MTDYNITKITTDNAITTLSFNVASLAAGIDMDAVARQISDFIAKQKPQNLIVDFAGVKFFSSQTLGVLIDARKKMAAMKANMVISGINPQLYRVFKITNLDKLFVFYPDAQSAISELGKSQKN